MKVLEVVGEPILHGGQEKFISSLIENIQENDMRIDVLTPYETYNNYFCNLVRRHGGEVFSLGLAFNPGKSRKSILKQIEAFLNNKRYDIVHIHSGSISVLAYAARASRRSGVKRIIVHSHSTAVNSFKHTLVRVIYGNQIKNNATDFWACSNEAGEDKYPKPIVENKLVIIPNGIDAKSFKRNKVKRETMRSKIGIGDQCYVIGHVGRFSYEKNHELLIDIFAEIHNKMEDSALMLVGDGELLQDIKDKVDKYKISNSVQFIGNVDNVSDYYQAMDCFAFPSRYEGFGYGALEAQAAGIPCVVSTEVPEDVVVGKNVSRLPIDDKNEWVKEIINNKKAKIADNTEAILAAGYDIKNTSEIVKERYKCMNIQITVI